jgi:hypothetical protein
MGHIDSPGRSRLNRHIHFEKSPKLNGSNWAYMPNPMGENWTICPNRMPGDAVQRTKDGSTAWNYDRFHFTFDPEACLSNGTYPLLNSVNQIDFGPLESGVLANTTSVDSYRAKMRNLIGRDEP